MNLVFIDKRLRHLHPNLPILIYREATWSGNKCWWWWWATWEQQTKHCLFNKSSSCQGRLLYYIYSNRARPLLSIYRRKRHLSAHENTGYIKKLEAAAWNYIDVLDSLFDINSAQIDSSFRPPQFHLSRACCYVRSPTGATRSQSTLLLTHSCWIAGRRG